MFNALQLFVGYPNDSNNVYQDVDTLRIELFLKLLYAVGIKFSDTTMKRESNGDTIDSVGIEKLMKLLKPDDVLGKETRLKAAQGNAWTWAKSALNVWGKKCGICDSNTPIMSGNRGYRKWCIRCVPQKDKGALSYDEMLERLYMHYHHKHPADTKDSDFPTKTSQWSIIMAV